MEEPDRLDSIVRVGVAEGELEHPQEVEADEDEGATGLGPTPALYRHLIPKKTSNLSIAYSTYHITF